MSVTIQRKMLKRTLKILKNPKNWTKGIPYQGIAGIGIDDKNKWDKIAALPEKEKLTGEFCLIGALTLACKENRNEIEKKGQSFYAHNFYQAMNYITKAIDESGAGCSARYDATERIIMFNDALGRRHEHVINILKKAIENVPKTTRAKS